MQFLEKAKKWGDMASVGVEFKDRLNRMERKFAVSMVIFKKFRPIFLDMFQKPDTSSGEGTKGNKPRKPKYDFILNLLNLCLSPRSLKI
jgi:retinoblastoma-like protein 1